MKSFRSFPLIALLWTAPGCLIAETAYSPVVGFLKFDCPAGTDTIVSAPFHPSPRWSGKLSANPAVQGGGLMRLSLAGSPAFSTGELTEAPHYLVSHQAAAAEGRHFHIVAHGADTVDFTASAGDLGTLATDGLVSVIPAWTLDTLFPPATQTTFHPSTGRLASDRGSELLFFDPTTTGSKLAPSRRFFATATGWFETGSFDESGDEIIAPGQAFIVRHPAGVAATEYVPMALVHGGVVTVPVRVSQGKVQDTMLALPRPVPVALSELDVGPVFEDSATTAPEDRKDELLVFDNTATGLNKTPRATYFRSGGQWLEDTALFPSAGAVSIEPSAGLLLRKATGVADASLLWPNAALYDLTVP